MTSRFHIVDDAFVVLRSRGIYRQAKVYRRGTDLFAGYGGGFIAILGNSGTSVPAISWSDLDLGADTTLTFGRTGRPVVLTPTEAS